MTHTAREEVSNFLQNRATDTEVDAAIAAAAVAAGYPEITGSLELFDLDDDDPVWDVLDAAAAALKPKVAVIFTDRAVLDGDRFPRESIASFVIEHAADDLRAEVWLVADPLDKHTADLIEWSRSLGAKLVRLPATRTGRDQRTGLIGWLTTTRPFERVIVADTLYESSDPRVSIHRRVTR